MPAPPRQRRLDQESRWSENGYFFWALRNRLVEVFFFSREREEKDVILWLREIELEKLIGLGLNCSEKAIVDD